MALTKAYKALTNPLARENFEKYGHPDGPQSLNTFFAIPQWFVEKRNYWKVVLLYFSAFILIAPTSVVFLFLPLSGRVSAFSTKVVGQPSLLPNDTRVRQVITWKNYRKYMDNKKVLRQSCEAYFRFTTGSLSSEGFFYCALF
jgi:hypothetical protein